MGKEAAGHDSEETPSDTSVATEWAALGQLATEGCVSPRAGLLGHKALWCWLHATPQEAKIPLKPRAAFILTLTEKQPGCSAPEAFPEIWVLTSC